MLASAFRVFLIMLGCFQKVFFLAPLTALRP